MLLCAGFMMVPWRTVPAEEPDTFDDFDQHTLVTLAHVEHQPGTGTTWTELTSDEIDDLVCLE